MKMVKFTQTLAIYKTCINKACAQGGHRLKCEYNDNFCSKCGEPLHHICGDCRHLLEDNVDTYCSVCGRKRELKNEKRVAELKKWLSKEIPKMIDIAISSKTRKR